MVADTLIILTRLPAGSNAAMRRDELRYDLPAELIAQRPAEPRDASRLLVLHRRDGHIEHRTFREIGSYLRAGDRLVLNDTRVIPARFFCRRSSGGRIEAFFLRSDGPNWCVLLKPSARLRSGERLSVIGGRVPFSLLLCARHDRGEWTVRVAPEAEPLEFLDQVGEVPLPPYIERAGAPDATDRDRYQTVFSRAPGAVAAPTAGLHFTAPLLDALAAAGVDRSHVTLHVGLGTFAAIDAEELSGHRMHAENYYVSPQARGEVEATRAAGGRIVAVGTTAARVLESLAAGGALSGETSIFIYPPYRFQLVDALLTNFHLPESTLLALVMALAGVEQVRTAYAEAVAQRYRFFSYGDAMLIV